MTCKIKRKILTSWEKIFDQSTLTTYQKQIEKAANYQEVRKVEQQLIQKEITKQKNTNQQLIQEKEKLTTQRVGLIILLTLNVLTTVGLLRKNLRLKKK